MRKIVAAALIPVAVIGAAGPAFAKECDRQCLINLSDAYVAALVAHNPSAVPLADDVRFVENAQDMGVGEGLWATALTAPEDFVIHVPDQDAQTVGIMATMTYMAAPPPPQGTPAGERAAWAESQPKSEQPVMFAVRLKLNENGEITEAEHIFAGLRSGDNPTLQSPRPGLLTEIPEGERLPPGVLRTIGSTYYVALDDNDGTRAPFAADCSRHENGATTSGGAYEASADAAPHVARDCAGQLSSGQFQYIKTIEDRRVFAADPVTGLAIGFSHFHHPMDNLPYEVVNTDGSTRMQDFDLAPFDALCAHIFKIDPEGEIHEIEAIGATAPFDSPHWDGSGQVGLR